MGGRQLEQRAEAGRRVDEAEAGREQRPRSVDRTQQQVQPPRGEDVADEVREHGENGRGEQTGMRCARCYPDSGWGGCRKQDGLKTGSALLDVPRGGGYIVEGEHFLLEHALGSKSE